MTTATLTLTEFLLARIAEDEADAKKVNTGQWYPWDERNGDLSPALRALNGRAAAHIARQSPARVLAECEAKRRIVQWHEIHEDCCEQRYGPFEWTAPAEGVVIGSEVGDSVEIGRQAYYGCVTSMMLAAPYADHPDYREEWR